MLVPCPQLFAANSPLLLPIPCFSSASLRFWLTSQTGLIGHP
jgi:hypothetical protein